MQSQVAEQILERGIDREYPTHGELLTDMSLILAATNGREIVVGADSLAYEVDQGLYRTYSVLKLRVVNGGHSIVAFSGLGQAALNVWESLEATGLTLNPDIRIGAMECIEQMGQAYTRYRVPPSAKVLLAGFSGAQPRIYHWDMAQPRPEGGESPHWGGIGCGVDVALHFVRNCEPLAELDVGQLTSLVHFSVSEIAKSDPRVGKPIDIAVITPHGAVIRNRDSLRQLEENSERLAVLVRNRL